MLTGITHATKLDNDWLTDHLYGHHGTYDPARETWERENPDRDPTDAPEFNHGFIYFGDWQRFDAGVMVPNKHGRHGFAALYGRSHQSVTVIWSRWYQEGQNGGMLHPTCIHLLTKQLYGEEGYSLPVEAFREDDLGEWGGEIREVTEFATE